METLSIPHSDEAESYILGAVLTGNTVYKAIPLNNDDFYHPSHQLVWEAMGKLDEMKHPIDVLSVSEYLLEADDKSNRLNRYFINEIALAYIPADDQYYINLLKKKTLARNMVSIGYGLIESAQTSDPDELLEQLHKFVRNELGENDLTKEVKLSDLAKEVIQDLTLGKAKGISTGYPSVDNLVEGLTPSDFIVIAGRPAMGKSALALNIATNVAKASEYPVLYFSLEMPLKMVAERVMFSEAETNNRIDKLNQVVMPDNLKPLFKYNLKVKDVASSIARHKAQYGGVAAVFIDHIGLMKDSAKSTYERMSNISNDLKQVALEFDVPMVGLCQLSRGVESRQCKKPMMSDLRDSGAIEQDADEVWLIYREEYYDINSPQKGKTDICIGKNRDGTVGVCSLLFWKEVTKFKEYSYGGLNNG
jgi:replicative DNA helicase